MWPLESIIFQLCKGCQWKHLPQVALNDSSAHRNSKRWMRSVKYEETYPNAYASLRDTRQSRVGWADKSQSG